MNPAAWPWLEAAIVIALAGALCSSRVREPRSAYALGLGFTAASFAACLAASLQFHLGIAPRPGLQQALWGRTPFALDEISAPLAPLVSLLHFLTALSTPRARIRRFAVAWSLASEALRLFLFSAADPTIVYAVFALSAVPPYAELANQRKSKRVYTIHMLIFFALAAPAAAAGVSASAWRQACLAIAILVYCGAVPANVWVIDWFERSSSGIGLLFALPMCGVYAAVRLLYPDASPQALDWVRLAALATSVYASASATVQASARRMFACLFVSQTMLVLAALTIENLVGLTSCLMLWISAILALGCLGLSLRLVESRHGELSLSAHHGLYPREPLLAVGFLLSGLGAAGFPGSIGFVAGEMLVTGALAVNPAAAVAVVATAMFGGIAIVRAYLRLFTGAPGRSTVSMAVGLRERAAIVLLSGLVIAGGVFPQPIARSRSLAAERILDARAKARLRTSQPGVSRGDAGARIGTTETKAPKQPGE